MSRGGYKIPTNIKEEGVRKFSKSKGGGEDNKVWSGFWSIRSQFPVVFTPHTIDTLITISTLGGNLYLQNKCTFPCLCIVNQVEMIANAH